MNGMRFGFGRYAPFILAAAAALTGCGAPSGGPSGPALPLGRATSAAHAVPACSGSRIGQVQCDVSLETGHPPYYYGWGARDIELAYNLPVDSGKGGSVFIVDAYDNPDVVTDFAQYRSGMGLPAGTINKYNQLGQEKAYPQASDGWGLEIDLDVDMAAAACPNCTVNLVEANSNSWSDIEAAETEAVKLGATIISNSFDGTGGEESYFDSPGVTYLAASGDAGYGLYDPATFDDVVAVGGTVLSRARNKRGYSETIWAGSNGGCSSTNEKKPEWQRHNKYASSCDFRVGNDVSAVAEDVAEYDTFDEAGWVAVDGTSISSPICAGIFALAGNATKQQGGKTFWVPSSHHKNLYVVQDKRFAYQPGWGSPNGTGAF